MNSIEVAGSKGTTHEVSVDNAGFAQCSCLAFRYRKRRTDLCKHIEALHARLTRTHLTLVGK